jgi:S1-C subfamily serine protease
VFRAKTGDVIGLVTGEVIDRHGTTGICFAVGINSVKALWDADPTRRP